MINFIKQSILNEGPIVEDKTKNRSGSITPLKRYLPENKGTVHCIRINNKPIIQLLRTLPSPKYSDEDNLLFSLNAKKIRFDEQNDHIIKVTIDYTQSTGFFKTEKKPNPSLTFYVDTDLKKYYPNYRSNQFIPELKESSGYQCLPDTPLESITHKEAFNLLKLLSSIQELNLNQILDRINKGNCFICYNRHGLITTQTNETGDKKTLFFISASKKEISKCEMDNIENEEVIQEADDLLKKEGYFWSKKHTIAALYVKSCPQIPNLYLEYQTEKGTIGIINGQATLILTKDLCNQIEHENLDHLVKSGKLKDINFKFQ